MISVPRAGDAPVQGGPCGLAMQLRYRMRTLMQKHRYAPASRPLALRDGEPGGYVEGFVSPCNIDQQRVIFSALAWGDLPSPADIPLLMKHDEKRGPVGVVQSIEVPPEGLWARVRIDDPAAAKLPGFSIGASVKAYEIIYLDDPNRFAAVITAATIDEISLTNQPANLAAVVQDTDPALAAVLRLMRRIELMMAAARERAAAPPPAPDPPPALPRSPRPRSDFSRLADILNERSATA